MTEETKPKIRKPRKPKEPEKIYLTAQEMRVMDAIDVEERLATKDVLLARAALALLEERQKTTGFQITLAKKEVKEMEGRTVERAESRRKNRKALAESYKIEGAWGYHPDTGEIIQT